MTERKVSADRQLDVGELLDSVERVISDLPINRGNPEATSLITQVDMQNPFFEDIVAEGAQRPCEVCVQLATEGNAATVSVRSSGERGEVSAILTLGESMVLEITYNNDGLVNTRDRQPTERDINRMSTVLRKTREANLVTRQTEVSSRVADLFENFGTQVYELAEPVQFGEQVYSVIGIASMRGPDGERVYYAELATGHDEAKKIRWNVLGSKQLEIGYGQYTVEALGTPDDYRVLENAILQLP